MEKIGGFLKRFDKLEAPERVVREACLSAVEAVCGVALSDADVSVRNKVIFLTGKAVIKSEVALHKAAILTHINTNLGGKQMIRDIK